ncbi:MAG: CdaR family protein [Candidatus Aminicenantes bacterium]|nr:CdaR family protein [Candidatus Aminicenantes bacterium]
MNKILRNIFVKNWGLKLFSFLLALVLWFTIIPDEKLSFEKSVTVPLETYNLPAGMEIVEKPPPTIDVTIKAPHRLIDTINPGTVRARLELSTARVEQTDFPINRSMISLPQGAEVKEWSPSQVRMRLEKSKEIMMEVVPDLVGKLPENLELIRVEVTPTKISIIGPESKVKETDKVMTSPIFLSSLTESIEIETDLILPDPDLRVVSYRTIITVKITIETKKPEEEVPEKKKSTI